MRVKLTDNVLKEIYLRHEKYVTVYDQFRPAYDKQCITPKFYSKYEGAIHEPDPVRLAQVIEKNKLLKEKRGWPETSNQWYGWFDPPYTEDKLDGRLHFPRKSNNLIKHLLLIRLEKRHRRK